MRKLKKTMLLLLVFTLLITGCTPAGNNSNLNNKDEQTTIQNQNDEDIADDTEGDTDTTQEDTAVDNMIVDEDSVNELTEEELLNEEQKNSIAMLNYLATLSQEINASKNSRMFLEEAYASLINNTNPEKVNELTESHMSSLLDIIEKYRLINVKRERLQYIYLKLPTPYGVLNLEKSIL